jgi:hypothetical protein
VRQTLIYLGLGNGEVALGVVGWKGRVLGRLL